MSKGFFIVIVIIFSAIMVAVFVRIEGRKEIKRLEEGDLSVEDFDIIE